MKHKFIWVIGGFFLIITLLTGGVAGGVVGYLMASQTVEQAGPIQPVEAVQVQPATAVTAAPVAPPPAVVGEADSVKAVERVLPAVVTVLNQGFRGGGSGSGVFINEAGYLVTNNHVVEGAQQLAIIYAQGGVAEATLVGTAPEFDLAVLKVDGAVPAVADWGDSSALPLGADVIAIGSALGEYQNTVTAGVLSGFNREIGGLRGLLQTDAAINSGNSGGPLINLAGQIVGINTLVVRGGMAGPVEGLGFAIPSNVAYTVAQRLIEEGEVRPAFLGIEYQDLNPQLVSELGVDMTQGALLSSIVPGAPAQQAGLQTGDIIVAVNGKPITDRTPLVSLLIEHVAGDTITLDVWRNGQTFQTTLTLAERA